MPQHILVVPYNPQWKIAFRKEAESIREILGDNVLEIHHIGNTAVEGLAAKPIIDIMPVVKDLRQVDEKIESFGMLGYEYLGEFGIPGRRYLRKGGDERTHQVHIYQERDCFNITRHLAVRDFLRRHEYERKEYATLKIRLAAKYPYDIDQYCDGKEAFVKNLEQKALMELAMIG